jgi:hypothetical protein
VTDFYKLAYDYAVHRGSALDKFSVDLKVDAENQKELEIELKHIIEQMHKHLFYSDSDEEIQRLEKELAKLNELLNEIVNPDTTPIMEK